MKKTIKIGLWLPPRTDLNAPISLDNPANIDASIHKLFLEYLDGLDVEYYEDLDFRKAIIKNHEVFIGDFCMTELDHFVWNGAVDRSLDSYHFEVLRVLELSVKVYNSHSFYCVGTDKFLAFSKLHKYGIPASEIYLVNQTNIDLLEPLFNGDTSFLLKPRRGSWGIGIVKVDSFSQLRDIIEYHSKKSYYLEKFYPNDMKDWIGVSVINGKLIYGFRKNHEKITGWKVYDRNRTGGKITYVKPNKEVEKVALKIGEILGASYYGLDFIKTAEGYKVVDINCHPGIYYDLIQELNLPIAKMFFKMLQP